MSAWGSVLEQLAVLGPAEFDPAEFDPADVADSELLELIPTVHTGATELAALLTRVVAAGEQRQTGPRS